MMPASDQRISLVALVTGASRGIGSIIARQLAAVYELRSTIAATAMPPRLPSRVCPGRSTRSSLPILATRPLPPSFGTM